MTPDATQKGLRKRLIKITAFTAGIIVLGVAGFMAIEGWGLMDSLYMAIITVSTVGYDEVRPLTPAGRVFVTAYIVAGVGTFLYVVSQVAEYIIAGHLEGVLGRKRMKKKIDRLEGHFIICGYGRVGRQVAREFTKEGAGFVVVDIDPDKIRECEELGYLWVEGNASDNDVLEEAGIQKARGLVAALDSDADNVYVALSAKSIKADIYVVARAGSEEAERKLRMAHADRVISPFAIGGRRLASLLLRPNVVEFLDVVMHSEETKLFMEEIKVRKGSRFARKTVGEVRADCVSGVNILAIKKLGENRVISTPNPGVTVDEGDLLITLGTREQLSELEEKT